MRTCSSGCHRWFIFEDTNSRANKMHNVTPIKGALGWPQGTSSFLVRPEQRKQSAGELLGVSPQHGPGGLGAGCGRRRQGRVSATRRPEPCASVSAHTTRSQ